MPKVFPSSSPPHGSDGEKKIQAITMEGVKVKILSFLKPIPSLLFPLIVLAARVRISGRIMMEDSNYFSHLRSGTITGIPAILLNEGL